MNIEVLFSTKERLRILNWIIYKTDYFSVSQVARDVKLSKGLVSKYLNSLTEEGILEKKDGKFPVRGNIRTKAVKLLLNLNLFDTDFFQKSEFIRSGGLYGSYMKGTNTETSDIDLWIVIEKVNEETLAKLTSDLKRALGYVRPLYLTKEKIKLLKRDDITFYHSILFGSITVYGEEIEALQL